MRGSSGPPQATAIRSAQRPAQKIACRARTSPHGVCSASRRAPALTPVTAHPVDTTAARSSSSCPSERATAAKSTMPVAGECSAATPARVRLQLRQLAAVQPPQPRHAVGAPAALELRQGGQLVRLGGDHHLAAALVLDAVALAVLVQEPRALHAQPRLQRPGGVVDAGVHHAAVAAGLVRGQLGFLLEHPDRQARVALGQLARGRQAHDAGADDGHVALSRGVGFESHGRGTVVLTPR